jgi:hypothetical protein
VGKAMVTVLQGKRINTICPCYVTISMLSNRAQGFKSPPVTNPQTPIFDYAACLDIQSLQGDILIELFEEKMSGGSQLGQVIIPLSWLIPPTPTAQSPFIYTLDPTWFEDYPAIKPTPFNNGGKYRPYRKGLALSTGYGMSRPEKSMGFLHLEVQLELREALHTTMLRNPWSYAQQNVVLSEDDFTYSPITAVSAVMVAGFTLIDTYHYLENQPLFKKLKAILSWETHPALSVLVLFMYSYTALLAAPWQYPFLSLSLLTLIGLAAAHDRSFQETQAYCQDNSVGPDGNTLDDQTSTKSYTEMYKEMTQTAMQTEIKVRLRFEWNFRLNCFRFLWRLHLSRKSIMYLCGAIPF